jgi:hypothetical protein
MKKLLLIVVLAVFAETVMAQSFYNRRIDRKWIASAGSGIASYYGELKNDGDVFQGTLYNLEVGLERRINERISVRTNFTFFQVRGSDALAGHPSRVGRNLSFIGWNIEMAALGQIQLFPEVGRYYQRPVVNPYFFLGLGATYINPMAETPATLHDGTPVTGQPKKQSLRQFRTEQVDYSPVTMVIPFGIGVKMVIMPQLNIVVNGGYRYTFSDYIDDVSDKNPGAAAFSDPLAAAFSDRAPELGLEPRPAGAIRGNPDKKDGYFILSIRVDYYLPPTFFKRNKSGTYFGPKSVKNRKPRP